MSTDEPEEVPALASAILAAVADQLDIVVNQAVRKLKRAAQAGVEKGHWPRNEAWLAALTATAVQRLAQVDEQ